MTVRLYTLGRLSLQRDGEEVSGAAVQRRRLALMALLAAAGEGGLMREKALGFLWAEHPPARARQILAESLFMLRGALGKSAIVAVGDSLRLNPLEVWTDIGAFQERISAGALGDAVELYRGPFLDGFYVRDAPEFEQWAGREQDRLARDFGRAQESLAERASAEGDRRGCAEWWRRLAVHEPFSTRVALRYLEALVQAGEPVLAKRFAADFTDRVRRELGIEPDASVLDHARTLITGAPGPLPPSPGSPVSPQVGHTSPGTASERPPDSAHSASDLEGLGADLEIDGVIGEGSVARVYLAREHVLRRLVAVKVRSPTLARDDRARARFEREALAAASIQHPNVAPVYRTGRLGSGAPYLVMPYFHGGSLENRLRLAGPLPPEEAQRYIGQAAAGLAAAHRLGIVHHDIRPANILYDRDAHRVVLIDFGIAAVLDTADQSGARLTRPGERLGDPSYVSPEQLRGEPVTDRADVYSLGIVAFEMLTGRLPFDARTPIQLMKAHAVEEPWRVSEVRPEVGAELDELIGMCLRKRPEERPLASDVAEEVSR